MKRKLSITLDEETYQQIEELTKNRTFRNRSHVIELAVQKFTEERK